MQCDQGGPLVWREIVVLLIWLSIIYLDAFLLDHNEPSIYSLDLGNKLVVRYMFRLGV